MQSLNFKIAYLVSRFFDLVFWIMPIGALIVFSPYFSGSNRIIWIVGLLIIAGVLPFCILLFWLKKGKVSDLDFSNREERTPIILIILFCWILALIFTWALAGPRLIIIIFISAIITGALVLIINLFWKTSNHTLAATIIGFLLIYLYGWSYSWVFVLIPLAFWSRLVLKKHNVWQLANGIILGCLFFVILRILS
ncbi:MAG: hypothetical protein WCV50_05315 [Patescibacteria group bacterium]|jgi:hypothetical protein